MQETDGLSDQFSNEDEWAEVDKYRQLLHDREVQLHKERHVQGKQEVKGYLDDQIKEKI